MKKFKKILLIVGITMLLAVIGVGSISAVEYEQPEHNEMFSSVEYTFFSDSTEADFVCVSYSGPTGGNYNMYSFTENFYEKYVIEKGYVSFSEFVSEEFDTYDLPSVYYFYSDGTSDNSINLIESGNTAEFNTYTFDYLFEIQFNTFKDGIDKIEFSNKQLASEVANLNSQVTELNTTITQKDAAITEKDTAISNLESQNNMLESDVDGLNTQVSSLVLRNTELSAQIKSLENQLQLKINKAYAEGLTDSEGGLTTSGIISLVTVLLIVVEVIALIAFFVARAKKRKHR